MIFTKIPFRGLISLLSQVQHLDSPTPADNEANPSTPTDYNTLVLTIALIGGIGAVIYSLTRPRRNVQKSDTEFMYLEKYDNSGHERARLADVTVSSAEYPRGQNPITGKI